MSSIDYEVSYTENNTFTDPLIFLYMKCGSMKMTWILSDVNGKDVNAWKNIRHCMENGIESEYFGGGGNSSWHCGCTGNTFIIEYDISGWGDDSSCALEFPCSEMAPYVDKIIDILEHA